MSAFTFVACHHINFEIWRDRECGNWIAQSKCLYRAPPSPKSNKSAANMINKEKQRNTETRSTAWNAIDWYGSDDWLSMFTKCVKFFCWKCFIMATFFLMRKVQVPLRHGFYRNAYFRGSKYTWVKCFKIGYEITMMLMTSKVDLKIEKICRPKLSPIRPLGLLKTA